MTKQEATKYAERTKKRLDEKVGGDWQIDVFENLGWHCDVKLGSVTVGIHENLPESKSLRFGAYVGSEKNKPYGALAMWHEDNNHNHKNPEDAVYEAMKNARKCVLELYDNVSHNFDLMYKLREKMKAKELKKL